MGFDNECILNIQSLAGEYFCPVCRTLVYPNEALQSQCTHLYCKPCLAYVVSSTQACPYDGYLVTEAGSKPLIESNKALAETIGKIAVHCLYHRSGCTWQGSLSECTSHCSGCAFGNSPVVCNRCGVQIVHRQVQEHAQTCNVNGANAQAQQGQGTESVQDPAMSGAAVASEQSKINTQQGVQSSQSQAPQTAAGPPAGQNLNQQGGSNPQTQTVAPTAAPTPEQWYQYQQYYQQYPGYDPYQQAFQQYYPYQQQAAQQFQQHPPNVQGQPPPHPHPQTQPQLQPQVQPQSQSHAQPQPQVQVQPQTQLPTQSQSQIVPHGQPQPHLYGQAPVATQTQTQTQPNQAQHLLPAVQPHTQVQSQTHPPPPPHGHLHPKPYSQVQPHSVPAHMQQHMQGPQIQYQQTQPQMHHPQAQPHQQPPQGTPLSQFPSHPQSHSQAHPPQSNQPPSLNAPPQNQQSSMQSVTGHHSYPQPHSQQQMQQAPTQQHMMHIQPSAGHLPPTQVHSQFPQPPVHMRPPQPHAFPPNQQPQASLPLQGQVSSIPPSQQQIHPNNQQSGPSMHQRPVMHPTQQQLPQQYVQQQPYAGQVSAQVQSQLHPGHFAQQQSQLWPQGPPQGPPQSMQQHSLAYVQPQPSQSHVARPVMPNHGVQLQQFAQSTAALGVQPQSRPLQHSTSQSLVNPNYVNTNNNQLQASSEQSFVQSGVSTNSRVIDRKADQISERSLEQKEAGSPSQKQVENDVIGHGADLVEAKSAPGLKSVSDEHKPASEGVDSDKQEETLAKDAVSEDYHGKDSSGDSLEPSLGVNSLQNGSVAGKDATGASLKQAETNVANANVQSFTEGDKSSVQNAVPQGNSQELSGRAHLQHGPGGDGSGGFQGKGFEQSSHQVHFPDQGRRQLPPPPFGPSGHQQRPGVPSMSQSVPPAGPSSNGQLPGHPPSGHLGPRHLPQLGQVLNHPEHLQTPALMQPGSFQSDNISSGLPQPGSTAAYGRGPSQFGNTQRSFELQYVGVPPGQYNQGPIPSSHTGLSRMSQSEPMGPPMGAVPPGPFESQDGMMGRPPTLRGPEGQIGLPHPITPTEGDMFPNRRPPHFDGRRSDSHLPGSLEKGPFGQPFGSESSQMGMNGTAGGMRDERFKANEEHSNTFQMGPSRRHDQVEFQESLNQFPRPSHFGNEASPKFGNKFSSSRPMDRLGIDGPSRSHDKGPHGFNHDAGQKVEPGAPGVPGGFLPPLRPGALHPNDSVERARAIGNYDDNRGRSDSTRANRDFPGPVPGYGRHNMEGIPPRSPGKEYLDNRAHPYGGFSGPPRGIDDIDGREYPFGEGSRSFNLPSDSHENRFPIMPPGHMRRGEFDGPGNMRMGENLRSGDLIGQDVLPNHLRRAELFNPRNVSSHPPMGEPGFGSFPGYGRMGESGGPGGFPHRPFGEPFGKPNHPRLGEPGFRSSYSLQGFPNDGGFFAGDLESFDKLRKRKPMTTGWCRICKVDCETPEGLDMHSQTGEHQRTAMDMVISIKQKNAKKQKASNDHSAREEGSKSRNVGFQGRGKKP